jgi:putative ABC transport system permease protein
MIKSYFKIAWRKLVKNKMHSFINIAGLSVGMAVAMMIGLWMWDEVSFDKYHSNYESIGQLMTTQKTSTGESVTFGSTVVPLSNELRTSFAGSFKLTALTSGGTHILSVGETKISQDGLWAEPDIPALFSLQMVKGSYSTFKDPSSMLLSASTARALFGSDDPINKVVRIDNNKDLKVTGVYQDLPHNTTLTETKYLLPWNNPANFWSTQSQRWDNHGVQLYVQLNPHVDFNNASARVKDIIKAHFKSTYDETIQVFPMSRWHLYSKFENSRSVGGRVSFVWLFGVIGVFVLLLACINFMNLSTARSEKRAKEVGIRKAIGSLRGQLIRQFLSESILVVFLALLITIIMVWIAIPYFNQIADKQVSIPWGNPLFWLSILGFTFFTGLAAGSYPAFYLSGFNPVKVLKGPFRVGRLASIPRKVMVVVQFTVSIVLIIGTIIVFRQIQFAADRPVGYTRGGLITVEMNTPQIYGHYESLRNDLLATGAVQDMTESSSATTQLQSSNSGFTWGGKDPGFDPVFGTVFCTADYGKTVGWKIIEGRDFSKTNPADTGAIILSESALKLSGIKNPIGKTMHWMDKDHVITGIAKDMIMESPYQQAIATIFQMKPAWVKQITIRVDPKTSMQSALTAIAGVFKKYNPGSPFQYKFNDEEYAKKFSDEQRIGSLATVFAVLAIFISCLGLFGMASFIAEQRIKEIGVRKVLGATVFNLWRLLSADFIVLVAISFVIATPVAYLFMHNWLQSYQYRTEIAWWIFVVTALGTMLITLATVSYQSIKAALANPVKSLKTE